MSDLLNYILKHEHQFQSKARFASLYSDFRYLQTTNPDGYTANITAWKAALTNAAREQLLPAPGGIPDLLTIHTGPELLQALESKEWGRPLALGTVVQECLRKHDLFPRHEFLTRPESIYHRSWAFTPWQIIAWGLRQLGVGAGLHSEEMLAVGSFVLLSNVEELAQKVVRKMSTCDRVDRISSKKLFVAQLEDSLNAQRTLTHSDIDILLTYLRRDRGAILYNGETIKFIAPGESSAVITPEDAAIASLRTLIADQNAQMSTLAVRVENLSMAARKAVTNQNRVSALSALRSKKLAEAMLTRVSNNMAQLEEILNNVRQAADQVEMMKIMEASAGVLRSLHKEVGGVERVEMLVEHLSDEVGKVQEVDHLIKELGHVGPSDDLDIDEELQAMERADKEEKTRREDAETTRKLEALPVLEAADPSTTGYIATRKSGETLEGVDTSDLKASTAGEAKPASERVSAEAGHSEKTDQGEAMIS
ncbi:MAG: hypothetical protein M1816_001397 [Peltula sp. TS41687]|nr:MAG: hypothetical protein M1816_001397 [Peltula sp. TS41687]